MSSVRAILPSHPPPPVQPSAVSARKRTDGRLYTVGGVVGLVSEGCKCGRCGPAIEKAYGEPGNPHASSLVAAAKAMRAEFWPVSGNAAAARASRIRALVSAKKYDDGAGRVAFGGRTLGVKCVPVCAGGFVALSDCPQAFRTLGAVALELAGDADADVLPAVRRADRRSTNGRSTSNTAGQIAGLAWLRLRKLEIAEQPVDINDIGTQHVREERVSVLYREYLAHRVDRHRLERCEQGSDRAAELKRTAEGLRSGAVDAVAAQKDDSLGVAAPSLSTFSKWEREAFRRRAVPANAAPEPEHDPELGARNQRRRPAYDSLFDGLTHSKHSVHNAHKENGEEASIKASLEAATGDTKARTYWAGRLRAFYDRIKRERVVMESERTKPMTVAGTCFTGQDASDKTSFSTPSDGKKRHSTFFSGEVAGAAYDHSVMCQVYNSSEARVVQYIVVLPHIKPDSNMAMSCRRMLYETLVENGIELEQEIFHLTDSGSDEVSIGNVAFNALHLILGKAFKFTHGRGDVGHNHTFLDLLGCGNFDIMMIIHIKIYQFFSRVSQLTLPHTRRVICST